MNRKENKPDPEKRYQHFKLVSEGGTHLAAQEDSQKKCFNSIEKAKGCPNPETQGTYRATTGGCIMLPSNTQFLFSQPLEYAPDLDKGNIPKSIREEFKRRGLPLSDAARLNVIHVGKIWYLTDTDRKYSIRFVPNNLMIYTENF